MSLDCHSTLMLCTTKVKEGDKYVAIYVHWDGDRVGNVLKKKIKTYDDAISLISFGFMSVIEEKGILPYMYVCGRHYECESWSTLKPKTYKTLKGCIKSFTCRIRRERHNLFQKPSPGIGNKTFAVPYFILILLKVLFCRFHSQKSWEDEIVFQRHVLLQVFKELVELSVHQAV